MDRSIIQTEEFISELDFSYGWKDTLIGHAWLARNLLGSTIPLISELGASQTTTPSLTINLAEGWIYELAPVDASAYGPLASDSYQLMQQGWAPAGTQTLNTTGLASGQSRYVLIYASFLQQDQNARTGDTRGGIVPFWNAADPDHPWSGPNNSGNPIATVRKGVCSIGALYGTPATTGTEVPPTPGTGQIPLYLIDLTFGQTQITNGEITRHPNAPFLAGLLNSHHGGGLGQAPKIQLGGSTPEVQGILPLANMHVSTATPQTTSPVTSSNVSLTYYGTGNPNGNVAGNLQDIFIDTNSNLQYYCSSAGPASGAGQAVWNQILGKSRANLTNSSFPYTATGKVMTIFVDASAITGAVVLNLPNMSTSDYGNITIKVKAAGTGSITITPANGQIEQPQTTGGLGATASFSVASVDALTYEWDGTNWWID